MKKLSRSVSIVVFSLFISSLLLLSASARFADAGGPYAALKQKQMKPQAEAHASPFPHQCRI